MSYKYYIISPFSEFDYSFVSTRPKNGSSLEYRVSPKDAYFYRNQLKRNLEQSPYCQFDIHNPYLRSLSASSSPENYFKDRQLISEQDAQSMDKMLYGTNNPNFSLEDFHIKSILKKSGSSFTPWFLTRGETSGLSQGRQTFGCFGNDYLIVKVDGDLPYYSWTPANTSSTRLDSALILNKDLNIRGDEYSWMYDNQYKEANLKSFDWGNLSVDSRIFNNFSYSWFHNELQGPYSENKSIVAKSLGNCGGVNDCDISFFIMGEIESPDEYKTWVGNNYSKKHSNLLNKDYRWDEDNIPIINLSDIKQKSLSISPSNPILVGGSPDPLSLSDLAYSPASCPDKWEKVSDGSAICIPSETWHHQICLSQKQGIELLTLQPEGKFKLDHNNNVTVSIPGHFEVGRTASGDTVKIAIELYPTEEGGNSDYSCNGYQENKLAAKFYSRFKFHPHFSSENKAINNKIKLPKCYFENGYVYTFNEEERLSIEEAIEYQRRLIYCELYSQASGFDMQKVFKNVRNRALKIKRLFELPDKQSAKVKTPVALANFLNFEELYYPGSNSAIFSDFHDNLNGEITPKIESKINPHSLIPKTKATRNALSIDVFNENKISSGIDFTMYINESGVLFGSGNNAYGQMGLGSQIDMVYDFSSISIGESSTPSKEVFCGKNHSLVIKEDGSLWGSGSNEFGQLGQEDLIVFENFVKIYDPSKDDLGRSVKNASAGSNSTHYVLSDGSLWGLGLNESFKVCHFNSSEQFSTPIKILDSGVSQVCSGLKFITLIKDNKLYIQGGKHNNTELNLIDSNVTRCAAGKDHVIFIKQNALWGFGDSEKGQLRNFSSDLSRPILSINESGEHQVSRFIFSSLNGQKFSDVSSSWASESSLILNRAGEVYFLGRNDYGLSREKGYMVEAGGSSSFKSISTSLHHSAYIDNSGNVLTQGSNAFGQLGNGNPKGRSFSPEVVNFSTYYTPTPAIPETVLKNLFTPYEDSIYLIKNKKLYKLHKDNGEEKVTEIDINKQCLEIHSGEMGVFCIAYDADKDIYSIEKIESKFTELNENTIHESNKKINDLSVGFSHVLFSDEDLDLWGFGSNESYAMGLGFIKFYKTPEKIAENIKCFSAGYKNSIFTSKGKGVDYLIGVGDNSYGRIGFPIYSGRHLRFDNLSTIRENVSNPQELETLSEKSVICSVPHKEFGGIKSTKLSDFNSAILCGNGKVFVGGFNNYNQIPSLSDSNFSNNPRSLLKYGQIVTTTAEFKNVNNNDVRNFYSSLEDAFRFGRFEEINGISNFKKIECKKAFLLLLGQDNILYGSGQNSHDASSSKISKSFISGSLGDSDLQSKNLTEITRNVKTFESNVFGTITLSSFNHSSSILSSGSYNIEVESKSFSSVFPSTENSSASFLSFFDSTSEASCSSDLIEDNILNIETEDEVSDLFSYTSKGSLEEKFKTLDGLHDSEGSAAIDINFINSALSIFDRMVMPFLGDENSYSRYLLIASRSYLDKDFLAAAKSEYICDFENYMDRPSGLREAIRYEETLLDYITGHDVTWTKNCDPPPIEEGERQKETRFSKWDTNGMVPFRAKKTDLQSPECKKNIIWDEPSFGTPTPTQGKDEQQILLTCEFFESSYGERYHESFILSPGSFAEFNFDGMLYNNTRVRVDYLGLGSAIINAQPVKGECDTYNRLETAQASGSFDWNKGNAVCSLNTEEGCTDPDACDYNPSASKCSEVNSKSDDCDFSCYGCMDSEACNHDPNATLQESGSCLYNCYGCRDQNSDNFDDTATRDCDDSAQANTGCSPCSYTKGCMDIEACNFLESATASCPTGSTDCVPCDFNSCKSETWFKYINCETGNVLYSSVSYGQHAMRIEEE